MPPRYSLEPRWQKLSPAFAADYKTGVWGFEQGWIQAAYTNDLMKGKGAAGFGAELDNDYWDTSAIAVAQAHGFISGTVNAGDVATYGDLVNQTYNAYQELEDAKEFKVLSANYVNAKEIEVKFSQKVDKESAATAANYAVTGSDVAGVNSAKVQQDGKTVLLELSFDAGKTKMGEGKAYTVTVDNNKVLNESAAKKAPTYTVAFIFADKVKPKVTAVETQTNGDIHIIFSEKVELKAGYTEPHVVINQNEVVIDGDNKLVDNSYFVITRAKAVELDVPRVGPIFVRGFEDYAGNLMDPHAGAAMYMFTATPDTGAPAVKEIKVVNETTAEITFTKAIANNGDVVDFAKKLVTLTKGTAKTDLTPKFTATYDATKNKLTLQMVEATALADVYGLTGATQNKTVDVDFKISGYKDASNNVGVAESAKLTFALDVVQPQITKAEIDTTKKIITFTVDKKFVGAPLPDVAGLILKVYDGDGKDVTGDILTDISYLAVAGAKPTDADTVTATLDTALANGTYYFTLKEGAFKDNSLSENENAAGSAVLVVGTAGPGAPLAKPAVTDIVTNGYDGNNYTASAVVTAKKNIITVTFDKAVKGGPGSGSALSLENYALGQQASLPAGTIISLDNTQTIVTIELAKSYPSATGWDALKIRNIQELVDGGVMTADSKLVWLVNLDQPELVSATYNADTKNIDLKFSKKIGSILETEFTVEVQGHDYAVATATISVTDATKVSISVADVNLATGTVKVKVAKTPAGTKDVDTNVLKGSTSVDLTR